MLYRKVQDALEKQNRENFKKRDHEKRKVDAATEKAKELMRVKPSFFVLKRCTSDCNLDWFILQRRDYYAQNASFATAVNFPLSRRN